MSKHVNNDVMMNLAPIKRAPQRPYEKGEIWVFSNQDDNNYPLYQ